MTSSKSATMDLNQEIGGGMHARAPDGNSVTWKGEGCDKRAVGGDKEEIGVFPLDKYNVEMLDNVAPKLWLAPTPASGNDEDLMYFDIVSIGAGAGGLSVTNQSARRGARAALIERHMSGGDCLNVGCVPSKGLIRSARAAKELAMASAKRYGVSCSGVEVDFGAVMEWMRKCRAEISNDDAFTNTVKLGGFVFHGDAEFTSPDTIQVKLNGGGVRNLRFGKAVVSTGGSAFVPPISGLRDAPYHTNASLFNLTARPPRMVVIGAGPIGCEMAQAFALLGTKVTGLVRSPKILPREDPEAAQHIREALEEDGVTFLTSVQYDGVKVKSNKPGWSSRNPCVNSDWPLFEVSLTINGEKRVLECECVLVATGRKANVDGLGLDKAGVEYHKKRGVKIDDHMFTSNPKILAVGDVCQPFQFTHVSGNMAQACVENALVGAKKKFSDLTIPWCTFTEPEVAHTGKTLMQLEKEGIEYDVYKTDIAHNDRAILEGSTRGFVKAICRKGTEEILGATIVADTAGDMITAFTIACQFGIPLGGTAMTNEGLGGVVIPYPTVSMSIVGTCFQAKMKSWKRVKRDPSDPFKLLVVEPDWTTDPVPNARGVTPRSGAAKAAEAAIDDSSVAVGCGL